MRASINRDTNMRRLAYPGGCTERAFSNSKYADADQYAGQGPTNE
jgi:hypothetical protein